MFSIGTKQRFRAKVKVDPDIGCWLWVGGKCKGYGIFHVLKRKIRAHRYLWELVHGPIPLGMELDHTCNNKACVNPAHLEPVTHGINMQRAALRGVWSGERNSQAKLTKEQVLTIRVLNKSFMLNGLMIAKLLKMPWSNIYYILRGDAWKNVKLPDLERELEVV